MPKKKKKIAKFVKKRLELLSIEVASYLDKLGEGVVKDVARLSNNLSAVEQILLAIDEEKCAKFGVYPF